MSSFSRVRRSNAGDAGGKILRGRRAPPPASPYLRPAPNREELPSPSGGQSGGSAWISGIVAGAGKLLSSFFKSDSPSASCSYFYSTDGDSDEGEMDVSSKEPGPPKQIKRNLEPVKDCNGTSLAIISEIDSKHAIEQLVMQETFSRDEGYELIKIIESRVVEVGDGVPKGLEKTMCNAVASHQTWKSLNLSRKLPETISCSSGSLNAISSRSAFQVLTPELTKSAVRESKKWFGDKKLASSSKLDFDCRPCTLNTKMYQYDFGVEEGSPVDVAKSYMRSLSPWRSPSLGNIHFEKSPSIEMHLFKDETLSATPNYSMPSFKGLKRNHQAFGSHDTVDEIQNVRLKSTVDESNTSKFKPIDLSKRYSTDDSCKISSVETELIQHNSSKFPASESLDAPAGYFVECARDYCSVGTPGVPGKITEGTYPVRPDNTSSPTLISDTEEAVNAVQSTHETSSPVTLSSRLDSSLGISSPLCEPTVPISEDNQKHAEVPSQVKEQPDILSGPCTTLTAAPKSVECAGDHSEILLISESPKVPPVHINSTRSDVEAGTRLDDVNVSSIQLSCGVENNSVHQKLISCVKEIHSVADSTQQERGDQIQGDATQQDLNDHGQNEANGLIISADGLNTNVVVVPGEEPSATNFTNGEKAMGISERPSELPSPRTDNTDGSVPKITTNSIRGRSVSRGGTRMMSVEAVLTEPPPSTRRGRGRKSAPGARRGRGKPMAPVDAGS